MTDTPTGTGEMIKRLRGPVRQAAQDLIDAAFNNREGRGVQFSIPAKPDEDTDLVLVAGIKDAADALEAAERERDELRALVDRLDDTAMQVEWLEDTVDTGKALTRHMATALEAAERVMKSAHSALDAALGDTDITHIEDDDELRDAEPVQWAAEQIAHWLAAHATGQHKEPLTDVQRSIRDGTFGVRSATDEERAAGSPMAVELWAAGADQVTARFVARMLHQQGYRLVKLDATGQRQGGDDDKG